MALDLRTYAAPLLVSGTSRKLLSLGEQVDAGARCRCCSNVCACCSLARRALACSSWQDTVEGNNRARERSRAENVERRA
jgi:hypothetical protein